MLLCDKRDWAITGVFCRDLHLKLMFSGLCKKIRFKENKVGEKLFQTKLLSRLSHKVCRLRSSPVMLHKFSNIKSENVRLYVESISTLFVVCLRHVSIQRVCLHTTSLSGLFRLA